MNDDRCALCFFGLPRAYKDMVLPSIVKNVLIPNARHNCDIYVHFYHQYEEKSGRKNRGGKVDPNEILLLGQAAKDVQKEYGRGRNNHRTLHVAYTNDTEAQFLERRGDLLKKYHETVGPDGKPAYFPWRAFTYQKSSLDNIVKQWHSINDAFKLMDASSKQFHVTYSRVGMFRSDVMFLTPIDIAKLNSGGKTDTHNHYAVIPGFGHYTMPVNDRMIYGPYEAVNIWSTKRFELIEERVKLGRDPGYAMHSERFLNNSVFPAIEASGFELHVHPDICFLRTRADYAAMISDCSPENGPSSKHLVEEIVQKQCTQYRMGVGFKLVGCGEGIEYKDGE
jgi:hypothetical protein